MRYLGLIGLLILLVFQNFSLAQEKKIALPPKSKTLPFEGRWSGLSMTCKNKKDFMIEQVSSQLKESKGAKNILEIQGNQIKQSFYMSSVKYPSCLVSLEGELLRHDEATFLVKYNNFTCSESCRSICLDFKAEDLLKIRKTYYFTRMDNLLKLQYKVQGRKNKDVPVQEHACGPGFYEVTLYRK